MPPLDLATAPHTATSSSNRFTDYLTPNWYASIMGTGIVANAIVTLPATTAPLSNPLVHTLATGVWLLASTLFAALTIATIVHHRKHPRTARSHAHHPTMMHFYGAPAMACLTIGAGTLNFGDVLLPENVQLGVSLTLWSIGTIFGFVTCIGVPVRQVMGQLIESTRASTHASTGGPAQGPAGGPGNTHRATPAMAWLMPVVPPMVSATTGAALIPHLPTAALRTSMLYFGYACFGVSLLAAIIVFSLVWGRLVQYGVENKAGVPTLFIGLGPLGQGATALLGLGAHAHLAVSPDLANLLHHLGSLGATIILGFAGVWACIAATIVLRVKATHGLPFNLTWWSFTFPIGTCVTGLSGLATALHFAPVTVLAYLAYTVLVLAWSYVALKTVHGSLITGALLAPPAPAPTATQ